MARARSAVEKDPPVARKRPGRRRVDDITAPQQRTLQAIQALIEKQGFPPTMKELAAELEITPASVFDQIAQLSRKGYIRREPRKARSIVVLGAQDAGATSTEQVGRSRRD